MPHETERKPNSYKISKHTQSDTYMHIYVCVHTCVYILCVDTHIILSMHSHTHKKERNSAWCF